MKHVLLATLLLALGACTATERGAIGGAVSGDIRGAAVGGAVGTVAGALIGRASEQGQCYYRDGNGRRYTAACP